MDCFEPQRTQSFAEFKIQCCIEIKNSALIRETLRLNKTQNNKE